MNNHTMTCLLALVVSTMTGCVGNSQVHDIPSKPTVGAYCHEEFIQRIDIGEENQSHGDIISWSADVFDSMPASRDHEDVNKVGSASGYMIVTRPKSVLDEMPETDREFRLSTMSMSWSGTDDSIIFTGVHAYSHDQSSLDGQVTRPIVGGTGRFLGQDGIATVTSEGDDWFRVEIYLTRPVMVKKATKGLDPNSR
jgi:hypothetical protein